MIGCTLHYKPKHNFVSTDPRWRESLLREAAQKKKLADFETFAQIWVGGSGKNLIQKIDAIETKYLWEGDAKIFSIPN